MMMEKEKKIDGGELMAMMVMMIMMMIMLALMSPEIKII